MQLHRASSEIAAAGARLVVIGNGAPTFIAGFRDKSGYAGELYTDPSLLAFSALKLRRGVGSTFKLRSALHAVSAWREGHRQGRTQGDPWQQGGVFVIARDGAIVYRHASEHAGDHPAIAEVIEAAQRAA